MSFQLREKRQRDREVKVKSESIIKTKKKHQTNWKYFSPKKSKKINKGAFKWHRNANGRKKIRSATFGAFQRECFHFYYFIYINFASTIFCRLLSFVAAFKCKHDDSVEEYEFPMWIVCVSVPCFTSNCWKSVIEKVCLDGYIMDSSVFITHWFLSHDHGWVHKNSNTDYTFKKWIRQCKSESASRNSEWTFRWEHLAKCGMDDVKK